MHIVCIASEPHVEEYLAPLKTAGTVEIFHKQNLSEEEFVSLTRDAEILITGPEARSPLSASLLTQLPNLKFIALLTIGFNWVDTGYATSIHLPISSIKGATAESVAEHTWGMILGLAKRINEFSRDAQFKGIYTFAPYKGKEVYGKTLGIIGLGDIGKKVASIAKAFSMTVIGVNKSGNPVDGVRLTDLPTLYKDADIIAVCTPLTDETRDLINTDAVASMKPGVIVVNCAREEIVNKDAILEGIRKKKIFGYGVETTIMKPVPKDDPYYQYPNIIVTPHNAFHTEEGEIRTYKTVIENIHAFLDGNPRNLVTG